MAILITDVGTSAFERIYPQSGQDIDEAWLQDKLLAFPTLLNHLPNCTTDPIVPICRELPLRGASSTVYLDIFAVRRSGRPVLVECKLWRNPQARREVIGQTLEYAAVVRGMSYSDFQAIIQRKLGTQSDNPMFSILSGIYSDVRESDFVDTFHRCLATGDFDLVVAGDGIRSDVIAISELLNTRGAGAASLSLLDVHIYRNAQGDLFLSPTTILKSEVLRRQLIVDNAGNPVETVQETEDDPTGISPTTDARKLADRAFWDRFIQTVQFDHPEQDKPRHGGRNYVRLSLPEPADSMVCYRARNDSATGIFFRLRGDDGLVLFEQLEQRKDELEQDLNERLEFYKADQLPTISITHPFNVDDETTQTAQLNWLVENANAMVNTFRPLLRAEES